jgi:NADPH:quinone reductase-like Zn-dependent oxidoreductase
MKAAVIRAYGGPDELRLEDRPDPIPEPGYVLVRVAATSVNPFDLKMRAGVFKDVIRLTFPAILGFDVSGVVEAVGGGVESCGIGDRVFAQATHTYASLCLVKATDLVRIPADMDTIDVAALPTVTTTGSQLADLATRAQPSGTVLVTGAVGSVGRSAVFAAKNKGWIVIAGVRKTQVEHGKATGADRVVALDDESSLASLESVDAVADTVSGPTADRLTGKVKTGGMFASVLAPPSNAAAHPDVRIETMQVKPAPATLIEMAEAVRAGKLTIPLGRRFALAEANKAHLAAEKGASGKLLLLA